MKLSQSIAVPSADRYNTCTFNARGTICQFTSYCFVWRSSDTNKQKNTRTYRRFDTEDVSLRVPKDIQIKFQYTHTEATERSAVNEFPPHFPHPHVSLRLFTVHRNDAVAIA